MSIQSQSEITESLSSCIHPNSDCCSCARTISEESLLSHANYEPRRPSSPLLPLATVDQLMSYINDQRSFSARVIGSFSEIFAVSLELIAQILFVPLVLILLVPNLGQLVGNALLIACPIITTYLYPEEAASKDNLLIYWASYALLTYLDGYLDEFFSYYLLKVFLLSFLFLEPWRFIDTISQTCLPSIVSYPQPVEEASSTESTISVPIHYFTSPLPSSGNLTPYKKHKAVEVNLRELMKERGSTKPTSPIFKTDLTQDSFSSVPTNEMSAVVTDQTQSSPIVKTASTQNSCSAQSVPFEVLDTVQQENPIAEDQTQPLPTVGTAST